VSAEMNNRSAHVSERTDLRSWVIVIGIALSFFLWGLFIYFSVGVKWPPNWNFGAVPDIPGESPYSNYGPQEIPGKGWVVPPQHVMEGEPAALKVLQGEAK